MGKDKGLVGFKDFTVYPITSDEPGGFEVSTAISLPYVQSLDPPDTAGSTGTPVYADDEEYLSSSGGDTDETRRLTIAELALTSLATLKNNAKYDVDTGIYSEGSAVSAEAVPPFAATYVTKLGNAGGYRLHKHYKSEVQAVVPTQLTTADGSVKVSAYNVDFKFGENKNGMRYEAQDVAAYDTAAKTWLSSFESGEAGG
ncbi:hypothetical protein LJC42_01715 [Eubacteriales bacterium OttesenSCG-928-K08]|nr:hypothetical protein [Eubacteriales bacterium OttesenSCG-928-K08]